MWSDKLKEANVSIHVIATGGGAGLQHQLWEVPGSSAYFSGATFPYDQDEQAELLGFMPERFCSEEAAIDLASAAYMKAYKFGGKKPVGLGITASVASEKMHRGDHRVFACIITNDYVRVDHLVFEKGVGAKQRLRDGEDCDDVGMFLLSDTLLRETPSGPPYPFNMKDGTEKARARFFERPFFSYDGKRFKDIPNANDYALMPGSFNPPHEGHLGLAQSYRRAYGRNPVFEIGTTPPHKAAPTVQELLQRAKMLQGHDRYFSVNTDLYISKAKAYSGMPILVGADTLIRMCDPKWGVDIGEMLTTFSNLGTKFIVSGRMIDDKFVSGHEAIDLALEYKYKSFAGLFNPIDGRWDVSSSELRAKLK